VVAPVDQHGPFAGREPASRKRAMPLASAASPVDRDAASAKNRRTAASLANGAQGNAIPIWYASCPDFLQLPNQVSVNCVMKRANSPGLATQLFVNGVTHKLVWPKSPDLS